MFDAKFAKFLPEPDENSYKYTRGRVGVYAGSVEYPGAAILAAEAAARAGAGYVTLNVPADVVQVCQRKQPAIVTRAIDTSVGVPLQDCLLCGPGRGGATDSENETLAQAMFKVDYPLVADAEIIQCVKPGSLAERENPVIITPHAGELSKWLGSHCSIDLKTASPEEIVQCVQDRIGDANIICVAKGHNTLVISKDSYLEPTPGTEALATAGTGDVLAGTIAGLIAQKHGQNIFETCATAVEVHALAGILASQKFGTRGVIASDVVEFLGLAIDQLRLSES